MTNVDLANVSTDDLCAELYRRTDCVSVTFTFGDLIQRFWEVNDNRDGTPSQLDAAWERLTVNDRLADAMSDTGWSVVFDAICHVIDTYDETKVIR